jgi:hypothetical protein
MGTLYFIKGDSPSNWGAKKLTLKKGANVSRVVWQMSQDGWTYVSARKFNAWCKQNETVRSAEPMSAPTAGGRVKLDNS